MNSEIKCPKFGNIALALSLTPCFGLTFSFNAVCRERAHEVTPTVRSEGGISSEDGDPRGLKQTAWVAVG